MMGKKLKFAAVKAVLAAISFWNWCKVVLLFIGCIAMWTTEEMGMTARVCLTLLFLYLVWIVISRALLPQQKVETDAGFVTVRTFFGAERQFHFRDVGAFTYTNRRLTVRGKDGEVLCRLRRERWNMDPFLEDLVEYGSMSREGYVVGAPRRKKVLAILWLVLAVLNCGLWGTLWFLSRTEPWEAGALILLALFCTLPLFYAIVNYRRRFVRRLLVERTFLRYIPAFGRVRDYRWEDVFWAAQPGGTVHILEPVRQKKVAVLSGADEHLYELFCDFYAHVVERVRLSKEGKL